MIKKTLQLLKRTLTKPKGLSLDSVYPVSVDFGEDRGTPIDRFYIENFLSHNRKFIKGNTLEIAENKYTKQFGSDLVIVDVLHPVANTPGATVIGDLTNVDSLPLQKYDCFVCTQTLQFIYKYADAIKGAYHVLKPGGVVMATVSGITPVSQYDMDRWGDYWRFTTLSAQLCFEEVFGKGNVQVESYGNCFAAISFLRGIALEEIDESKLQVQDKNFPLIITIVAKKAAE